MPGARGIFAGTVGTYNQRLQLTHPGYTMLDDFDAGDRKALIPIYRSVGKLHTWTVTESVRRVLDVLDDVPDALPADVRARRKLVSRTDALRGIHTPDTMAEVETARRRLRYEEASAGQPDRGRRGGGLGVGRIGGGCWLGGLVVFVRIQTISRESYGRPMTGVIGGVLRAHW